MQVQFTEKDFGWENYLKGTNKLDGCKTKVGFPDNGDMNNDHTNLIANIAFINEYGMVYADHQIPPRPFMRQTLQYPDSQNSTQELMKEVSNAVRKGTSYPRVAMSKIGDHYTGEIRKTIDRQNFTKLSNITIALKGSSKILVDTGTMYGSIKHVEVIP